MGGAKNIADSSARPGHGPTTGDLDLSTSWNVWKGLAIRGGINNILDKDPPLATFEITAGGAANTYSTYDQLGR